MPKSHCHESSPEWGRIDHVFSRDLSWLLWQIPVNLNSVLLIHGMFQIFMFPMRTLFTTGLCVLKTCSFLLCRTSYLLYYGLFLLYSGCCNCLLHPLYMYKISPEDCETRRMELKWARNCCKIDIPVNSC